MATSTDQQQQHPSPSPPPKPPTAQTPGPRATAFTAIHEKTLNATLAAISYEAFAECFPHVAEEKGEMLKELHGQMVERLGGFVRKSFEEILIDRNVVENLNKLEDIIADARRRKARAADDSEAPIPTHTLPPSPLTSLHLAPHLSSQQSHLNARLQTTQSQNAQLASRIQEQKAEIEKLVKGVEALVGDLEGAAAEVGGRGEELAERAREAEGALGEFGRGA